MPTNILQKPVSSFLATLKAAAFDGLVRFVVPAILALAFVYLVALVALNVVGLFGG